MARTSPRRGASRDRGILERLDEGTVLGDGGYLLELEKRGYVQAGPFTPEVVLEHPAAVKELHQEFLDAGAEVLQSVAFYASKEKLATTGFADRVGEINRSAVRLAREVAGSRALDEAGVDIVGVNCLRNPMLLLPIAAEMRKAVTGFVACQPTAYRTPPEIPDFTAMKEFPYETETLVLSRRAMGAYAAEAKTLGINYIGSCCGSVPIHVREMARALGKAPKDRSWRVDYSKPMSAYEFYHHPPP